MSVELLQDTEQGLQKAIRLANEWSGGAKGGIVTTQCKKSDLDYLKSQAKSAANEARQNEVSIALPNKAIYNLALWRDAKYALRGRRWLRAMGVNSLATAAVNRYEALNTIDNLKRKEDKK